MKQNRKLRMTAVTVANCKNTGDNAEDLAACALTKAGFARVENLNIVIRQHFPCADLLAEKNGVWYAVSVKGRNRISRDGKVNTGYKVQRRDAISAVEEIRRVNGVDCVPAFAAVEFDGDRYSVYFDLLERSSRKNRIGMKESERAGYQCLIHNELHYRSVPPNEYSGEPELHTLAPSVMEEIVRLCHAYRSKPKSKFDVLLTQIGSETFDLLQGIAKAVLAESRRL